MGEQSEPSKHSPERNRREVLGLGVSLGAAIVDSALGAALAQQGGLPSVPPYDPKKLDSLHVARIPYSAETAQTCMRLLFMHSKRDLREWDGSLAQNKGSYMMTPDISREYAESRKARICIQLSEDDSTVTLSGELNGEKWTTQIKPDGTFDREMPERISRALWFAFSNRDGAIVGGGTFHMTLRCEPLIS